MMSAMTAHRSPDTDPKDSADQILVPKDDAEHTYARLAHTRATRLTGHDKLSESHRSPPPSRQMSRCMPLPRRCTSHARPIAQSATTVTLRSVLYSADTATRYPPVLHEGKHGLYTPR